MIAGDKKPSDRPRSLPLFLEEFKGRKDPAIRTRKVKFPSALGPVPAYLARPDTNEQLPAILLIPDKAGPRDWYHLSAREISSIGYLALAMDRDYGRPDSEEAMAELFAAVRWLRKQEDVLPGQIGVVGWGVGGQLALSLSTHTALQACVMVDNWELRPDGSPKLLRRASVLGIFSGADEVKRKKIVTFRKMSAGARIGWKIRLFEGARPGFMGPPGNPAYAEEHAEEAWLDIYEFLGKHVEDTPGDDTRPPQSSKPVAMIADVMRAINSPTGVRGALIGALDKTPNDEPSWKQVRSLAAVLAEGAHLLARLKPTKGTEKHWRNHTRSFQDLAEKVVQAADRHDLQAARQALTQLGNRCAACHKNHR